MDECREARKDFVRLPRTAYVPRGDVPLLHRGFPAGVVRKYDIQDSSSCDLHQFVFVVKTTEYGNYRHAMVIRNVMPLVLERDLRE